jgi:hypothetical protein
MHPETHVGALSKANADYSQRGNALASGKCLSIGFYVGKRGSMDVCETVSKLEDINKVFIGEYGAKVWSLEWDEDSGPTYITDSQLNSGINGQFIKALQQCAIVYDNSVIGDYKYFGHDGGGVVNDTSMAPVYVDKASGTAYSVFLDPLSGDADAITTLLQTDAADVDRLMASFRNSEFVPRINTLTDLTSPEGLRTGCRDANPNHVLRRDARNPFIDNKGSAADALVTFMNQTLPDAEHARVSAAILAPHKSFLSVLLAEMVTNQQVDHDTVLIVDGKAPGRIDTTRCDKALVKKHTHQNKLCCWQLYISCFVGSNPPVFPASLMIKKTSAKAVRGVINPTDVMKPIDLPILNAAIRAYKPASTSDLRIIMWALSAAGVISGNHKQKRLSKDFAILLA